MIGLLLIALGVAIGALALALLTANVDPRAIDLTILGRTFAHPSGRVAVLVVTVVVAVAATVVTLGVVEWRRGAGRGRRPPSTGLEARDRLLEDQIRVLQRSLDTLQARRDELSDERDGLLRDRDRLLREQGRIAVLLTRGSLALQEILALAEEPIALTDMDQADAEATIGANGDGADPALSAGRLSGGGGGDGASNGRRET